MMNVSSWSIASIAKAVERSPGLAISVGHSERMHAPSGGSVPPASGASAIVTIAGVPREALRTSATSSVGKTTASGVSTRPMPKRSIRRPSSGCIAAKPSA